MRRAFAGLIALFACAVPIAAQCPSFTRTNYTIPGKPRSVIAADFNGDGNTDLLVGVDESSGNVILFPGKSDGTFGSGVSTVTTIPFVWAMASGDFNRDGKLDVVATNEATVLAILLGNGDGTFAVNRFTVSEADDLYGLTVADFNGDGKPDLAMLEANEDNISIRFGNGDGSFGPSKLFVVGGSVPRDIVAADFNGDGKIDLAMGISTTVSILINKGNGTFAPEVQNPSGITPTAIAIGDFDLDGRIDVVTADQSSNSVSVLLGKGDGTFKTPMTNPVGTTPWGIATGSFNGRPGVAVPNWGSNNVSVLVDTCAVPKRRAARH